MLCTVAVDTNISEDLAASTSHPLLAAISPFPASYWLPDSALSYTVSIYMPPSQCHSLHPEDGGSKLL